jgi:hypothetical protein
MNTGKVLLSDGSVVTGGPWVQFHINSLKVGVFHQQAGFGKNLTILKGNFPAVYDGIELPSFQILQKELWTKELISAVESELTKQDMHQTALAYIAANLSGALQEPKELKLASGLRLVGNFSYRLQYSREYSGHRDLLVAGIVIGESGAIAEATVFTIKNLRLHYWPPNSIRVTSVKNK